MTPAALVDGRLEQRLCRPNVPVGPGAGSGNKLGTHAHFACDEGQGSADPLVTALTVVVCAAAETLARSQPGGRLTLPMIVSLDEAANVCRWKDLPDLYSHYGSRGILISTYLQSWSQGVQVWGRDGMRKLWSAANIKVYGGGVSEVEFLREMSQLIGEYRAPSRSVSHGKHGRSVTVGESRNETILDVADLASLERGRAVVFASGARPLLARTQPWMDGPHAAAIAASLARHDPSATHLPDTDPGGNVDDRATPPISPIKRQRRP